MLVNIYPKCVIPGVIFDIVLFLYLIPTMQAMTVSVSGESVGTVRERATWWNPVYHVFDSVGNQVLLGEASLKNI